MQLPRGFRPRAISFVLLVWLCPNARAQTPKPEDTDSAYRGNIAAQVQTRVEPEYPLAAKAAGVGGSVIVRVMLDREGRVVSAIPESGHPLLLHAAAAAVRGWTFKPRTADGAASLLTVSLPIRIDVGASGATVAPAGDDVAAAAALVASYPFSPEAHYWLAKACAEDEKYVRAEASFNEAIKLKSDYFEAYIDLGEVYDDLKQTDEQLKTYQRGVEANPDSIELLGRLARARENKKQFAEAADAYRHLTELSPDDADAFHSLGWDYAQLRRYQDAVVANLQAIKLRPDSPGTYHNLGWDYLSLQRYNDAIEAYQTVLRLSPQYAKTDAVYRELGTSYVKAMRFSEGLDALNRALELRKDNPESYSSLGWAYSEMNRYDEAITALRRAIELDSNHAYAYEVLGGVYFKLSKVQEAEDSFRRAAQLDPQLPEAWANLASVLLLQMKTKEAETALRQALAGTPNDDRLHITLGAVLDAQFKFEQAEGQYREALRINPDNVYALNGLGASLTRSNRNLDEAVRLIQRAVSDQPDNSYFLANLAAAYLGLGRTHEAELEMRHAVEHKPDDPQLRITLGSMLERNSKHQEAEDLYRDALRTQSNNPVALNNLGYALVERGDCLDVALVMIQRAVDSDPHNSYFLDSLGWAYFKLGKLDQAEKYVADAARGGKDSAPIFEHLGDIYDKRGKKDLAVRAWRKALSLSPDTVTGARLKTKLGDETRK